MTRIKPSQVLAQLGVELPAVAAPVAAYIPATWDNTSFSCTGENAQILTSGQLPLCEGKLIATGKVGTKPGLVSVEEATECARQCALNAIAAAADLAGGVDKLAYVVKVTGFVSSDPDFTEQPAVINGASELVGQIFANPGTSADGRELPRGHARSAVGVAVLPLDAPVEIEITFAYRG